MTHAKRWKFLNEVSGELKSQNGDHSWIKNQWYTEDSISLCSSGFHASEKVWQAFSYVQGSILARVEVKGDKIESNDKSVHQSMRVVKLYRWTKMDSVALAIFAAELVINNFETAFPSDYRPRKAIESAKVYLADPSEENQATARSAARSARSAARSAWSAARSAWSAARSATLEKIDKWMSERVSQLEEITNA